MNFDLSHDTVNTVLSALQLQAAATQNAIAAIQLQLPREPQTGPLLGQTVGADGWVPHVPDAENDSPPRGLDPRQEVEVRFRDGSTSTEPDVVRNWYWGEAGDDTATIVAYRLVPESTAAALAVPPALRSQE